MFYPIYPTDQLTRCEGTNETVDANCDVWKQCLHRQPLEQPTLDTSDNSYNFEISVVKSAKVNAFCDYAINANVTLNCGPPPPPTKSPTNVPTTSPTTAAPTALFTNFSNTFDVSGHAADEVVMYTIPVQSTADNSRDELFHVDFAFSNGQCHNPRLTVSFEEV